MNISLTKTLGSAINHALVNDQEQNAPIIKSFPLYNGKEPASVLLFNTV
jgi:hypothetical protein